MHRTGRTAYRIRCAQLGKDHLAAGLPLVGWPARRLAPPEIFDARMAAPRMIEKGGAQPAALPQHPLFSLPSRLLSASAAAAAAAAASCPEEAGLGPPSLSGLLPLTAAGCYTYIYIYMHACMYVCMHVCMHACMYGWMEGWMYGWMDVHMYMYMCMYIYI